MTIRDLTIQPTFDFTGLSEFAMTYERKREFKEFIVVRLAQAFLSATGWPINPSQYAGREGDFYDDRRLVILVKDLLETMSAGHASVDTHESLIGPQCWPDPDDPFGWIRERGIRTTHGPSSSGSGPLIVGPLPESLQHWPDAVKLELAACRLYVRVTWRQGFDTPEQLGATQ